MMLEFILATAVHYTMWLPVILCFFFLNVKHALFVGISNIEEESLELTNLLVENLKADPSLIDDHEVSEKTKRFVEKKIAQFIHLVSQSQNAVLSRTKRSLNHRETNISRYSINITTEKTVPTEYPDDIRIFKYDSALFAVSLQDKTKLVIFEYTKNGSFEEILKQEIKYNTNLAVLSTEEEFPIIAAGEREKVLIFKFNPIKRESTIVQTLTLDDPRHVVVWEQNGQTYLSITQNSNSQSTESKERVSTITVYKWLGKHFDLIQEIELFNIKKSVPFSVHGSHFLAAVKYLPRNDEIKSYSEIFKFDLHSTEFKPYQRLLTNECSDIKYFTSELQGEKNHFLVVVYSTGNDFNKTSVENNTRSVIYKYEDQYFMPFQNIKITTNAVEWQPIQDFQGHAALIGLTSEGLKGIQYDGWRFFQSNVISDVRINLKLEDITAVHTYEFEGQQILVFSCNHCKNTANIFKVNFNYYNPMEKLHSQVLSWCTENLKHLESIDESEFVAAESLRGDLNEQISLEEDQKRQLSAALKESNEILTNLEDLAENYLQSDDDLIFDNDIEADDVIFNDKVTFKSLNTISLNEYNINDLIDNVLNISEGFILENLPDFSVILSKNSLDPKIINDVPLERYIFLDNDATLNNLAVNGSVIFKSGVNVDSKLNNVTVDNNLLLKNGSQEVLVDLNIDDIIVHNLTAKNYHYNTLLNKKNVQININDMGVNNLSLKHGFKPISHIKSLRVKKLEIGGLMNRVSIPVLEKHALKKSGDQILEETLHVDSLNVRRLNVEERLSGKIIPHDFVMVNFGEFTVNQDVRFLKGLKVNKLEVLHSLNNITVTNEGELDILLTDSPKIQFIPIRTFENLFITNPIMLRNRIANAQMDQMNPMIIDNDAYEIDGDVTIEGLSEVERWLRVEDLKGKDDGVSFRNVLQKGIKITDTQIPVHLNFTQPLDLDDTIADRVNLLNPHDWLLHASESPQIVQGHKTFLGDLHLKGPVNTFRLNDVDVLRLQKEALRIEGDQNIEGAWEVNKIAAEKGITSNNTIFGNHSWNPDTHNFINKATEQFSAINSNTKVNITKVKHLHVRGLMNLLNISETVKDIVKEDAEFKVYGKKKFENLHVDELVIREEGLDLVKLLNDVMNNEVTLPNNMDLYNEINIENINFAKTLNNLTKADFQDMINLRNAQGELTTVPSDREYDQIVVFGEVFISDNLINGKNLTSIEKDTVKADEDYEFNYVNFGEAIFVQNSIQLEGNIENLDLNNIVEQYSNNPMEQIQDKVFTKNIFVDGTLLVENTLNGIDLKKICHFSGVNGDLKTLKIEGDAVFVKGPKILNINGLSVRDLMENLWFADKKANISGTVHLQDTTFDSPLNVEEFIDQCNLKVLSQNYFSKTKNQSIPALFSFENVTFSIISTPQLVTTGTINGIVLDDLLKTMLLQNISQIFENPAYFEEVTVKELNEDTTYFVNDLNIKTDVMLYDTVNAVTGRKSVKNFNSERIKINQNVKIQDVDILEWLSNAMLTNGTFSVAGKKVFKNATFKQGLSLRGSLNDEQFNEKTIMLVDTPQNITGTKTFVSTGEDMTKFKILRVKGLVNDMNLESFVRNQSNKIQNNILNSEIVFNNSVVVKNINIDVTYDAVNVTELLHNVTKLGDLKYFQEKYENLLDMSLVIEDSVKDQATFFKYFKEIMFLNNVYEIFGLKCKDEAFRLLTFSFENGTNIFRTREWNEYKKKFVYSGENVESYSIPSFMEHISMGGKDYIYMEHPVSHYGVPTYGQLYLGQLLQLINSTTFEPVAQFQRNATKSLISFVPPGLNQPCLGFIDVGMTGMEILCDESGGDHFYYRFQMINMEDLYMATTVRTQDFLYLFLARRGQPLRAPSIVVLESYIGSPEFKEKQTIFEGAELNGLSAAVIYNNVPYVAFSFGPQEATIDAGRISIRKLDPSSHYFVHWQHIPLTAPLGAHFITKTSFEPLLLVPSADASSPLQTLRYDGSAGFKRSLKGAALPPKSRIRLIQGGRFVVALQDERGAGVILGAVIKGPVRN